MEEKSIKTEQQTLEWDQDQATLQEILDSIEGSRKVIDLNQIQFAENESIKTYRKKLLNPDGVYFQGFVFKKIVDGFTKDKALKNLIVIQQNILFVFSIKKSKISLYSEAMIESKAIQETYFKSCFQLNLNSFFDPFTNTLYLRQINSLERRRGFLAIKIEDKTIEGSYERGSVSGMITISFRMLEILGKREADNQWYKYSLFKLKSNKQVANQNQVFFVDYWDVDDYCLKYKQLEHSDLEGGNNEEGGVLTDRNLILKARVKTILDLSRTFKALINQARVKIHDTKFTTYGLRVTNHMTFKYSQRFIITIDAADSTILLILVDIKTKKVLAKRSILITEILGTQLFRDVCSNSELSQARMVFLDFDSKFGTNKLYINLRAQFASNNDPEHRGMGIDFRDFTIQIPDLFSSQPSQWIIRQEISNLFAVFYQIYDSERLIANALSQQNKKNQPSPLSWRMTNTMARIPIKGLETNPTYRMTTNRNCQHFEIVKLDETRFLFADLRSAVIFDHEKGRVVDKREFNILHHNRSLKLKKLGKDCLVVSGLKEISILRLSLPGKDKSFKVLATIPIRDFLPKMAKLSPTNDCFVDHDPTSGESSILLYRPVYKYPFGDERLDEVPQLLLLNFDNQMRVTSYRVSSPESTEALMNGKDFKAFKLGSNHLIYWLRSFTEDWVNYSHHVNLLLVDQDLNPQANLDFGLNRMEFKDAAKISDSTFVIISCTKVKQLLQHDVYFTLFGVENDQSGGSATRIVQLRTLKNQTFGVRRMSSSVNLLKEDGFFYDSSQIQINALINRSISVLKFDGELNPLEEIRIKYDNEFQRDLGFYESVVSVSPDGDFVLTKGAGSQNSVLASSIGYISRVFSRREGVLAKRKFLVSNNLFCFGEEGSYAVEIFEGGIYVDRIR